MKKLRLISIALSIVLLMSACGQKADTTAEPTNQSATQPAENQSQSDSESVVADDITDISLSDSEILVENKAIETNTSNAVYKADDIIYYENGKNFTYGEGTEEEAHSKSEADSHTVIHITKAGKYRLNGKLSRGQIAVDLGEDAKKDSNAVVTLILDNIDITCEVAPAVIFYNVYESSDNDAETATKDVDTSLSGANIIIADDSKNTVNGSYVAKIYKPDSVVLSADGTKVEDAEKLHKYDGAFYSRMSMNINGEEKGNGILNINATNEGLDSELHLTINGGVININSGNDGINTNEDNVSVTTINGGELNICVTGETGEGDGIDSNGWLVINGGKVKAEACSFSADAGIDSDMGIHINGGTVFATGSMLDRIEDDGQAYALFSVREKQSGVADLNIKNADGEIIDEISVKNNFSIAVYSSSKLEEGTYQLYNGDTELAQSSDSMAGIGRPDMPFGETPPNGDPNMTPPEKPFGEIPPNGDPSITPPEIPTGIV
jgi:hypothetical protein